jgi:hypothetical protein
MVDSPGEILLALGRLEGKVDALITQQLRTMEDLDSLDLRVRALEGSKALLFGGCTAVGACASYLVTLLG